MVSNLIRDEGAKMASGKSITRSGIAQVLYGRRSRCSFCAILDFGRIDAMRKTATILFITLVGLAQFAIGQTATPTPTPTPTPIASPAPATRAVQSLPELQGKIRSRLMSSALRRGQVGVKIVSLATGEVVYEANGEKYVMPASD